MPSLVVAMAHPEPLQELIWLAKETESYPKQTNRPTPAVFCQVNDLTWPTEESDELKHRRWRACRAGRA